MFSSVGPSCRPLFGGAEISSLEASTPRMKLPAIHVPAAMGMRCGDRYTTNMTIFIRPREGSPMLDPRTPIVMEVVTDLEDLARSHAQDAQIERNSDWLQAHIAEVYSQHRGRFICVSGEELFVGNSAPEVESQARAVHPEDEGMLTRYIPKEKGIRIYAH